MFTFITFSKNDTMHKKIGLSIVLISFFASEVFFYVYLSAEINRNEITQITYFCSLFLFFGMFGKAIFSDTKEPFKMKHYLGNFLLGFAFTLLVTKLTFVVVILFGELLNWLVYTVSESQIHNNLIARRKEIKLMALILASVPFVSFLYGITRGKYNYKVINIPVYFSSLPKSFEGYKVVQISDVHAGSFDSKKQVSKGVEVINNQNADLFVFTGDLVNNFSAEIKPFISMFKKIKAKDGKFSITGNHDYGDYVKWDSKELKQKNFESLIRYHKEMDFDILMNEHIKISRGKESIVVIGIENWGVAPFPAHGDLPKATKGLSDDEFKLLLSHDPSHWDEEVKNNKMNIDLTMSGHTHGMQFGFDFGKVFKWSPVKYKYKKWSGLYRYKERFLYVNKGFGFLGFPGRVGMWPEITVFELKKRT